MLCTASAGVVGNSHRNHRRTQRSFQTAPHESRIHESTRRTPTIEPQRTPRTGISSPHPLPVTTHKKLTTSSGPWANSHRKASMGSSAVRVLETAVSFWAARHSIAVEMLHRAFGLGWFPGTPTFLGMVVSVTLSVLGQIAQAWNAQVLQHLASCSILPRQYRY